MLFGLAFAGDVWSNTVVVFNPTSATRNLVEVVRYQRLKRSDGLVSTSNGYSKTWVQISKQKDGYQLRLKSDEMRVTTDGKPITNPLNDVMSELRVTARLDPSGNVQEVRGLAPAIRIAQSKLEPELYQRVKSFLTPEVLSQRVIVEWDGRYQPILGRVFRVGETQVTTQSVTVPPNLPAQAHVITWVEQFGTGPRSGYLKLRWMMDTDPQQLIKTANQFIPGFKAPIFSKGIVPPPDSRVSGQMIRWIELDTGLIRDEWSRREVSWVEQAESGSSKVTVREDRSTELKDDRSDGFNWNHFVDN